MTIMIARKKPVEIEACEYVVTNRAEIIGWTRGVAQSVAGHLVVKTLEGNMQVSPGDYVIKGVQGEFYPCKPDIFAATYDVIKEAA